MRPVVSIITPVYNENKTLRRNIKNIQQALTENISYEIIIVDDNSPDGSGEIADELAMKNPNIRVLHRQSKQGLGTAYKEGFHLSTGDLIVSMDSDLSHDPRYIPEMIKAISEADIIIGSRLIKGGRIIGRTFTRDALSILTNNIIRILTGINLRDWTSGLRVYKRTVWEDIMPNVNCDKWDFQFESLYKSLKKGYTVREVPITFYERADGESKFSIREGLTFLASLFKIMLELE
ncbi:MAG: polyprenol monophosphomannose synthase [Candidatus Bathyarchaeota archaeon]|nr:polyprenol monophosphomannose synthase [Candidatus Bathyarchaeota archaeon]